MFRKLINTTNDPAITVLRLILGVVFFAHGAQKTLGWFGGYGFSGTMGFFAFGIACNMVVAIAMVHRHIGFFANWYGTQKGEGYEYHLLAIAVALAIMIKGSGAFSIDRALSS